MPEKRLSKRMLLRKRVKFGSLNPTYHGFTFNVSEWGIGIKTYKPLIPKSQIIVDIFLGDEIHRIGGIVNWVSCV